MWPFVMGLGRKKNKGHLSSHENDETQFIWSAATWKNQTIYYFPNAESTADSYSEA